MAEESDLEKTEPASQRRLEKAREEGQVPNSRELATFLVTITGVAGMSALAGWMWPRSADLLRDGLTIDRRAIFDPAAMFALLIERSTDALLMLAPLFIALMLAAFVSPFLMAGWNFAPKALEPKFSKLNPAAGLKRMFSSTAAVELGKSIGKATLVGGVAAWVVMRDHEKLFALFGAPVDVALGATGDLIMTATLLLVAGMALIVAIDVPFQLWHYQSELKMTKEEARQEFKEQEGDPHVKGRIRQQQREMARSRMMANVPKADVVVTNPTHYSVALRYDAARGGAPRVVAKGAGEVALRIRTVASEHGVPLVEAPPLARALHKHCELEQEVPARLFRAVAEVLAYVYQLNDAFSRGGDIPKMPGDLPVPDDMDPGSD
ncbi:MAG: flagellar biosynthesis protein FlhB [Methyloversatilis sp.]|nr:flagellar biosynthesis protein FlhB [Methyloversatilis sp.]